MPRAATHPDRHQLAVALPPRRSELDRLRAAPVRSDDVPGERALICWSRCFRSTPASTPGTLRPQHPEGWRERLLTDAAIRPPAAAAAIAVRRGFRLRIGAAEDGERRFEVRSWQCRNESRRPSGFRRRREGRKDGHPKG